MRPTRLGSIFVWLRFVRRRLGRWVRDLCLRESISARPPAREVEHGREMEFYELFHINGILVPSSTCVVDIIPDRGIPVYFPPFRDAIRRAMCEILNRTIVRFMTS